MPAGDKCWCVGVPRFVLSETSPREAIAEVFSGIEDRKGTVHYAQIHEVRMPWKELKKLTGKDDYAALLRVIEKISKHAGGAKEPFADGERRSFDDALVVKSAGGGDPL